MSNLSESDDAALVAYNKAEVVSSLQHDREYGTATKPPFLINPEQFSEWRRRFIIFVTGFDQKLTKCYEVHYECPKNIRGVDILYGDMQADEKIAAENEAKAYSILCQSLPKDLDYLMQTNPIAAALWDALVKMFEGNEMQRKIEREDLNRDFENFCCLEGELFPAMMNRFWKLISKLSSYGIVPSESAKIDRIVVALPDYMSAIMSGIRKKHDLSGMTAYALAEELKNEEFHE